MHCFSSFFYYIVFLGLALQAVITSSALDESEFYCLPLKLEPREKAHCVIKVQDLLQKPTKGFDLKQFSVSAHSSVKEATLDVSPLRFNDDSKEVVFDISGSEATNITLNVMLTLNEKAVLIRNSGLVLFVLSCPAVRMGPIICNVSSAGLALRSFTVCKADLYDNKNHTALLHKNDIAFTERKNLGSFDFISGKGELVFSFTAANATSTPESSFVLFVKIKKNSILESVSFPLFFPELSPAASTSFLRCSKRDFEFACILNALDLVGPVRLRLNDFQVAIDTLDESSPDLKWIENSNAFKVSITTLESMNTAIISWHILVNNVVKPGRIHVYIKSTDIESKDTFLEEVQGSPFGFITGVIPTASSIYLRGCEVSVIRSGNRTMCFIDVNNASGDMRYFHIFSKLNAVVENITYIPSDTVFHSSIISFVYVAPPVQTHLMDHISLLVGGLNAVSSPFSISVFPSLLMKVLKNNDPEPKRQHNGAIIIIGLVFYGAILFFGCFFAVRRTLRINRIRRERAMRALQKQTTNEQEMKSIVAQ